MNAISFRTVLPVAVSAAILCVFAGWSSLAQDAAVTEGPNESVKQPAEPAEAPAARQPIMTREQGFGVYFPAESRQAEKILRALDEETTFDFIDIPLSEVMEYVSDLHDIPVILHTSAMDDLGIPTDEPINLRVKGITLRSALSLMLDEHELVAFPRKEVLFVTTKERAEELTTTRTYPVSDLVTAHDDGSWEELVDAILETTSDAQWAETDGNGGSIATVKAAGTIVVKQSFRGHESVLDLLTNLRRSREVARLGTQTQESVSLPPAENHNWNRIELVLDGKSGKTTYLHLGKSQTPQQIAAKQLDSGKGVEVLIRADPNVKHEDVVLLLDQLHAVSPKVSFVLQARPE